MATKKKAMAPENRIFYILAYLIPFLSGIFVYVTEGQRSKEMKFHALQGIFLGIVIIIFGWFPILNILAFVLWLYGMYVGVMAYNGKSISMPILGPYASQYSK